LQSFFVFAGDILQASSCDQVLQILKINLDARDVWSKTQINKDGRHFKLEWNECRDHLTEDEELWQACVGGVSTLCSRQLSLGMKT